MVSRRNRPDIDCRRQLDFPVVSVLPQGCVRDVTLNERPPGRLVP